MPPKIKKTCSQKLKVPAGRTKKERGMDEKENQCSNSELTAAKSPKAPDKLPLEEKKVIIEQKEFVSPPQTPKLKPTGFWSKKLQDLEENKTKKKCGLYDFSGTDESDSSFKVKKKRKQTTRLKKPKQPAVPKYKKPTERGNKENKIKQTHKMALVKEQIMLSKERKKLDNQNQSFTFSTEIQTLGITSTPAVKKNNLIGASNFLFLSPIIKEEPKHCNSAMDSSPVGLKVKDRSPLTQHLNKVNPSVETKLKQISCKRVLRSGKTLGT